MADSLSDIIDRLPTLRDVIADHELRAQKSLGQNFLLDMNVTDKIVRHAGDLSGKTVVEIGPGPGGLTRSILRANPDKLYAVEFDTRAVHALGSLSDAVQGRLEIIHQDALTLDISTLEGANGAVIIANLPYNIATPLLIGWLRDICTGRNRYEKMVLMFQKEVAERLTAVPGTGNYGRLSVLAQWICHVDRLFDLPPQAFSPPPKVVSRVVGFSSRLEGAELPTKLFAQVEEITQKAFGKRRKMIRQSLKEYSGILEVLNIDPTLRAENLDPQTYVRIAEHALDRSQ